MILQRERLFVPVRAVPGHHAVRHRAQNLLAVMHQHSVEEHRGEGAADQFFALELRGLENNVVRLPLALGPDRIHQRRPLSVKRPGLPVRVSHAHRRLQHLNLVAVHQQHAAIAPVLILPLNFRRLHPFDVQLHVAELLARDQGAGSRGALDVAVRHLPPGIHLLAAVPRCIQRERSAPSKSTVASEDGAPNTLPGFTIFGCGRLESWTCQGWPGRMAVSV